MSCLCTISSAKESIQFQGEGQKALVTYLARHQLHHTGLCSKRNVLSAVSNLTRQDFRHTSAPKMYAATSAELP